MKFWQKAFIVLSAVFVISFNLCMVIILHFTYQEELRNAEVKASGEAYFIMSSICKDLSNMDQMDRFDESSIVSMLSTYLNYYEEQKVQLGFWQGDEKLQSNLPEGRDMSHYIEVDKGKQLIKVEQIEGRKYMFVASRFMEPYEEYKVVYGYALDALEASNHRLLAIAIVTDGMITFLLAILLYCILNHLTKPLNQLALITDEVAKGQYDKKVQIKGSDEFAMLGERLNRMSSKIQDQIELLKLENEKKQLLIDNMAHEIRTPLTSISGYAEYMKVAPLNEEQRIESLDYIMSESKRLQKLSQIILKMADLRQDELEVQTIEIHPLIESLKAIFIKQDKYQKVFLKLHTDVNEMQGNSVLIESLLINLIENGMRACKEKGQVEVYFRKRLVAKGISNEPCNEQNGQTTKRLVNKEMRHEGEDRMKEQIEITIKDTGVGMEAAEVSKIAQPFYRIDKARSRKAGGVGLGVSLCQEIVKAHDGKMFYASKLGEGTVVTLLFPNHEDFTS